MSYKYHKDGYKQTASARPSEQSQMPSTAVPKRVNKSSPDERGGGVVYLSAGVPDNNTKSIPDTATRAPDIAIRNGSTPTMEFGNLGLM